MAIKIDYLANHPQHIQTVIDWVWEEWDRDMGYPYENTARDFAASASLNSVPMTILAFESDVPVGMAALLKTDFLERPEPGPWRANLLVQRGYRGRGIATALLCGINDAARRLGYNKINVWSAKASRYAGRPEYAQVGEDTALGKKVYVYEVDLAKAL